MSPGKARLLTGVTCVGTLVSLAIIGLSFDVPGVIFPDSPSTPTHEFFSFAIFFAAIVSLLFPFDFIGGVLIPNACESSSPTLTAWLRLWSRSVAVQILFYSFSFFFYLQFGREVGAPWLIALFSMLQIMLLAGQELIWQIMTANRNHETGGSTSFVSHSDQRFAGGIAGLPGFESILIPEGWKVRLQPSDIKVLVTRRNAAVNTGLRLRGIMFAMLWNLSCFTIAIVVSGGVVYSVADLVRVFLWFLLFSFIGLIFLPMFNRRGVFALDQQLATDYSRAELQQAICNADSITEQDPDRSASAESIFQPIPCPARRIQALAGRDAFTAGAWNVARMALFLSWAFGGPLARAVHCNVGRPELWAILPTD